MLSALIALLLLITLSPGAAPDAPRPAPVISRGLSQNAGLMAPLPPRCPEEKRSLRERATAADLVLVGTVREVVPGSDDEGEGAQGADNQYRVGHRCTTTM